MNLRKITGADLEHYPVFPKITQFKTIEEIQRYLDQLGVKIPMDEAILSAAQNSPMSVPLNIGEFSIGNRWCIQPMEGWDANADGTPSEYTLKRWENFGLSGAKWIWGGEAFAVQNDGRSGPSQSGIVDNDFERAEKGLTALLTRLKSAHLKRFGSTDDLFVGLQLTHSGRFSFPNDKKVREPKFAYHHPILDRRCGIAPNDNTGLVDDDFIKRLIDRFVATAKLAQKVGFQFVDVKHCHGYLSHELLSARTRPGMFGGSFENRTRFAREVVARIKEECPGLKIGVRLSAYDTIPFKPAERESLPDELLQRLGNKKGPGVPEDFPVPYPFGFGVSETDPLTIDLTETIQFIRLLVSLGANLINLTSGSPYYCPHIQRPATYPPCDGYLPPEDPLIGVARQMLIAQELKQQVPEAIIVGSSYTYLQDYLPQTAQAAVRSGWIDAVGFGRLVLSYWDLPADTLEGKPLQKNRICRTFSDCTTAPRFGLVSGCYPLNHQYRDLPQADELRLFKK